MSDNTDLRGYSLEADETVDFNPLENFDFDDDLDEAGEVESVLEEGPFGMPNPDAIPQFQRQLVSFADGETAEERIEALFGQMPTLQKMLYDILALCAEPIATEQLEAAIVDMKKHHHSIYSAPTLLDLLERAGAIVKTNAEGALLAETEQEPLKLEIGGDWYWHAAPAPQVYWTITAAGAAELAAYKPIERIAACYEAEPHYAEIFDVALRLCAQEGGTTVKQIDDLVGDEPILQKPRRFAMYFIDKLEHAGAVEWGSSWMITEAGREFIEARNQANDDQ